MAVLARRTRVRAFGANRNPAKCRRHFIPIGAQAVNGLPGLQAKQGCGTRQAPDSTSNNRIALDAANTIQIRARARNPGKYSRWRAESYESTIDDVQAAPGAVS